MKSLRQVIILLIVFLLISLTGCEFFKDKNETKDVSLMMDTGISEEDGLRETVLYYKDSKGSLFPL